MGPTSSNIFPKLACALYLTLIDTSSGDHNLKLDAIIMSYSIYIPIWWLQLCETTIQSFSSENIFQRKLDEIFKELPNKFGIAYDILVVGYNQVDADHDAVLCRLVQKLQ